MPVPSTAHQIFMGILWTGLAALIALAAVAIGILINRMRNKKMTEYSEAQRDCQQNVSDIQTRKRYVGV
jgi:uncharacterized membrane-anchored protein YhcB (DUF1043 family)